MPVRSKRLTAPTTVGIAQVALYTAPDGETVIVKHLAFVNTAVLANSVKLRLNGSTDAANIMQFSVAGGGDHQMFPAFLVLQPGDVLSAIASTASAIVTLFGAELEGVAD